MVFTDYNAALEFAKTLKLPVIVWTKGGEGGEGTTVCRTFEEVEQSLKECLVEHLFGSMGDSVAVEEMGKDKCEICHGERGGVPGNENVIDGWIVCDYCSVIMGSASNGLPEL